MPRRASALLTLALLLGACDGLASVDPEEGVEVASAAELDAYREAFAEAGVEDYRLRYDVVCFCEPLSVRVDVEGGRVVHAVVDGGAATPLTVLDLYDLALGAYAEADRVTVEVRPGPVPIPVSVTIDYRREMADEEVGYVVRAFEAR